jgi:hypothetical protein
MQKMKQLFLLVDLGYYLFFTLFSLLMFTPSISNAQCITGNTGGKVWFDYNVNGVIDTAETQGLTGVTVTAYNDKGQIIATTTTSNLGQYTFNNTLIYPNAYRLEFSNIPPQYKPTFNGANGRTDVQFVSAAGCNYNLGVNKPSDYCQSNPNIYVPCYVNGNPLAGSTSGSADWLVGFPYNSSGTTTPPSVHISGQTLGAVWGQAYQRQTRKLFSAALVKRHCGLGSYSSDGSNGAGPISGTDSGTGGIYVTDFSTGTPIVSPFVNLQALGIETGDFSVARNLPAAKTTANRDSITFGLVGKIGLGGLDLSEDETKLYVTNIYDRKIYQLNIGSSGTPPTSATAIPNAPWLIGSPCNLGVARPWGLKTKNGKLYIGVVCTAENGGTTNDLNATVYTYDLTTGVWNTAISLPLNYTRGAAYSVIASSDKWYPWLDTFNSSSFAAQYSGGDSIVSHPAPILSDIEFDEKGDMIIAFTDRVGNQLGSKNFAPTPNYTSTYSVVTGGEILKAEKSNIAGQWILENNGKSSGVTSIGANNGQGPGGGEFFSQDLWMTTHKETAQGSLAYLMGSNEVSLISLDPINFNSGGLMWFNDTNGVRNRAYQVYSGLGPTLLGKANGLGDIELLCNSAPIQIGNYVWLDRNANGVQDPNEVPLSNITVSLWKDGTQIASTTTNTSGEYYFSDKNAASVTWIGTGSDTTLRPLTTYEVRVAMNQSGIATSKYNLTTVNATTNSGNDQNDSDAFLIDGYAIITFTTGTEGSTNHTYDFGFNQTAICLPVAVERR